MSRRHGAASSTVDTKMMRRGMGRGDVNVYSEMHRHNECRTSGSGRGENLDAMRHTKRVAAAGLGRNCQVAGR